MPGGRGSPPGTFLLVQRAERRMLSLFRSLVAVVAILIFSTATAAEVDPLPSWSDGPTKQAIVDFVTKVTEPGSGDCVPQAGDTSDRFELQMSGRSPST